MTSFLNDSISATLNRGREHAPVAQLDRALVSGTKGRRFESYRAYQLQVIGVKMLVNRRLFI